MAIKKRSAADIGEQTISGIISDGTVIDGNFNAPAFVRIDGRVNGDVNIEQGLILGEKGIISGNITTKQLVVYGQIEGSVTSEILEVRETGKITGDIATQTIQVYAGAVYNGKLTMP